MGSDRRVLTLQEVADQLGVHYMTAYRYVRTGRLPARRDGSQWLVEAADVDKLSAPQLRRPRGEGRPGASTDLANRMAAGDEAGAWKVVESVLAGGAEPGEVVIDVIAPALRRIGDEWVAGTMTVAEEHRASAVAHRLLGRLGPHFARRGRKRGTIVVGAVAGDHHALPSAMLADVLRGEGFEVLDTGADTPAASFVETAAGAHRLVAVVIGATTTGRSAALRSTVKALRAAGIGAPILVGGAAVTDEAAVRAVGADGWTGADARAAIAAVEAVVG